MSEDVGDDVDFSKDANQMSNADISEQERQQIAEELARMLQEGDYEVNLDDETLDIKFDSKRLYDAYRTAVQEASNEKEERNGKIGKMIEILHGGAVVVVAIVSFGFIILDSLGLQAKFPNLTVQPGWSIYLSLVVLTIALTISMLYYDTYVRS
jgi:hypothetical protein